MNTPAKLSALGLAMATLATSTPRTICRLQQRPTHPRRREGLERSHSAASVRRDASGCALLPERAAEPALLGPVVGYKIGIYSKGARATYQTDRPAVGVLHRDMLQPEGQPIAADFAFMPLAEADFLAVIGDEAINDARTPDEAFKYIRAYRPFIELPDGFFAPNEKPDFVRLSALDVGARKGVMGPEFTLPQTREARTALKDMRVETVIQTPQGSNSSRVYAKELQGDLMQVVLDARDLLRAEGIQLKKGDLLSLGTLTPAHRPVAGEKFTVAYTIGDATFTIRQNFKP